MLDNWTAEEFFKCILRDGVENVCREVGRIAIIDNEPLEKVWDSYVRSRAEVLEFYNIWFHQG